MPQNNEKTFCFRCYHTWKRRAKKVPKVCPKCKNRYWNRPRKKIRKEIISKMEETFTNIHDQIIEIGGGLTGVRDDGGTYNSTYKLLNHQFKNKRNPVSIGAFAINEFAKGHHFNDGNKRTAFAVAKILMLVNHCHLKINYKKATEFMLNVAKYKSNVTLEEIKLWLHENCKVITEKELENYLSRGFMDLMLGAENDGK